MRWVAPLSLIACSGCYVAVHDDAIPVETAASQRDQFVGKEVAVVGWLDECFSNECRLYRDRGDVEVLQGADPTSDAWAEAYANSLNLCTKDISYTWASLTLGDGPVLVTGEVLESKFGFGGCDFATKNINRVGS